MDRSLRKYQDMLGQMARSGQCDVMEVAHQRAELRLPRYKDVDIMDLCRDVKNVFLSEPTMLEIESPVTIVGDLHGHILDLFRIIRASGLPSGKKYLFLGDFVDRGEFSLEVVTYVFLLKIIFPQNVFIIRGNHEFDAVCSTSGFRTEVCDIYRNEMVYYAFIDAFSAIPLCALISRSFWAVHGGIGPDLLSISQIRDMERPIYDFDEGILDSLLWSDPSDSVAMYEPSQRGAGYLFSAKAAKQFLDRNAIKCIIRGHQCVENGYLEMFDKKTITVFSASNYCGTIGNKSAALTIKRSGEFEFQQLPPLPWFTRSMAVFPWKEKERPHSVKKRQREMPTSLVDFAGGKVSKTMKQSAPSLMSRTLVNRALMNTSPQKVSPGGGKLSLPKIPQKFIQASKKYQTVRKSVS